MRSFFFSATLASVLAFSALAPAADVGVIPKLADLAAMKPVPAATFVPRPFEVESLQLGAPASRSNWSCGTSPGPAILAAAFIPGTC